MPKELDFENLRFCLDNYTSQNLYIRLVGSSGGTVKVNENLEDKTLDFKNDSSGLSILIDSNEVFRFPLKDYYKGFSLAYERFFPKRPDEDIERMYLHYGIADNPNDSTLPYPKRSFLRTVLDNHLMEIFFEGKIQLKEHSLWLQEPDIRYWTIDKSKKYE